MGRVKLQIKKIENTTNRQVTFSKRRNGLIKKAYELSVLCDVDVAVVMFSPSGRVSTFSGNKSIEEIMARYVNLPEHDRGRLHSQEYLQRALGKLNNEVDHRHCQATSPMSVDSQLEEIQYEILRCKSQLLETEKRLRIFEGDSSEITTIWEAEYRERALQESLTQIRLRKKVLEEKEHYRPNLPSASRSDQVQHLESENASIISGLAITKNSRHMTEWRPQRDPQLHILNFMDCNTFFPIRDEYEDMNNIVATAPPSSLSLINGPHINFDDDHINNCTGLRADDINTMERSQFGDVASVNLSPWPRSFTTSAGDHQTFPTTQPRERGIQELFLSELAP